MRNQFDPEKALETLLYVSQRARGNDLYASLKLIYLADKCHLERYGSLIFGETYGRLPYGPVPMEAYNAAKLARGDTDVRATEIVGVKEAVTVAENTIVALRDPDMSVFSKSDVECLDAAIQKYGDYSFGQLMNETHDAAYHATVPNDNISLEAIASTLPNAADIIQHLKSN